MSNSRRKRNSSRYFDEVSSQSSPGKLSKELRKALGLSDDMLPIWIYKMRVLGYPPGWCKQAEVQPNLDIIGDDQAKPRENGIEDGEIQPIIYDENATIEYPGYNARLPKNVKDDWLLLGYPPFIPSNSSSIDKEIPSQSSSSQGITSTNTKLNCSQETASSSSTSTQLQESSVHLSTQKSSQVNSIITSVTIDSSSTEIQVVDQEKRHNQDDCETTDDKVNSVSQFSQKNITKVCEKASEVSVQDESESFVPENSSEQLNDSTFLQKRKITVLQGESSDSYQFKRKKLPDLSKWAEGVTGELLNFENLPNSGTGNLKKIRDLLSTLRNKKTDEN